jgi:oligosaccharide 4-alpha-D-glucosyltransferase
MIRIGLTLCLLLLFAIVNGQKKENNSTKHKTALGEWTFWSYTDHIIKTTFQPNNYLQYEQVSNAVIAKPLPKKPTIIKTLLPEISEAAMLTIGMQADNVSYNFTEPAGNVLLLQYFDSAAHKGFRFHLNPEEKIFGTGERALPMNRRGYKLNLYNNPWYGYSLNADNLNYSVPFIISSNGYGIFFDNPSRGYIDIGKRQQDVLEFGASSGELSFYVIHGKNTDEIMQRYHTLVGTQPIPSRWVLGNLMSRFGYRSEAQLMGIVEKMKTAKFPVEAVIIDLFWFGDSIKKTMGTLEWVNKQAWPNPTKMIASLKKEGINTVLITEPFVLNTTANYAPSKKYHATDSTGKPFVLTEFYFGYGGLLDIYRKDAQQWFWSKYKPQIARGVAGWWGDLGEPEKHPAEIRHNLKDFGFKRLFKADEVHNIYGHYWDKMLFDRYSSEYPNVRLFNLNRSGYAGSPRYCVFPWSGDVSRSWDGLKAQLPLMLGMSISGVPYIHADAGGFAGGEGDAELYTRWLQFAAFTPVFRPHGTALGDLEPSVKDIPSEPALWNDTVQANVRFAINRRYALTPYNYTLAYQQEKTGKPLVRPMFYYDQSDTNLLRTDDQYMWGDNFLIAPVIDRNVNQRRLYLPEGTWYDYKSFSREKGRQWITRNVDISDIPVFVKEGSIIPSINIIEGKNLNDYSTKELIVTYFPSATETSYTLYDDDGKTKDPLKNNIYELITFKASSQMNSRGGLAEVNLAVSSNKGKFVGKPATRRMYLLVPWSGGAKDDRLTVTVSGISYPSELTAEPGKPGVFAKIDFPFTGDAVQIKISNK